jgi:hypothetical protein
MASALPLLRDTPARMVPDGIEMVLPAGTPVRVTQALGGSFTVASERGNLFRIAAELQRQRPLHLVVAEQVLAVAAQHSAGGDHLGVEQRAAGQAAQEDAEAPVGAVHHRRHGERSQDAPRERRVAGGGRIDRVHGAHRVSSQPPRLAAASRPDSPAR